jgi:serine/threonine-protein kinase
MSDSDDPDKKPPAQRTIAWSPEDVRGPADTAPPPAEPGSDGDPLVGALLRGKWRVLERIGAGSFGTVYKVQDVKGGWTEALKILGIDRLTGADAENMRARFLREARIMKRLGTQSQHIVGLSTYEEEIESGRIYFLMEFVEGTTLAAALGVEGPFEVGRTLRLALQVCDALMAAHEGPDPVVHRDLKLENLMLTSDRSGQELVKVLDFGIAKIVEREADSRLTAAGTLGTPGYAAPEQLRAGEVDGRTDLFALGVILYALLTGRDPWLGRPAHRPTQHIYELMVASERGEVLPMERPQADIPSAVAGIVMRLLRRDPADRFQSARELRDALQRVATGAAVEGGAYLRVITDEPGVKVQIRSGRKIVAQGPTPYLADPLPAGTYRVLVRDPAFGRVDTTVSLAAGAMEDVTLVTARRRGGRRRASGPASLVVTGGLLAIGLGAVAVYVQPLGRTLDLDGLRAQVAAGTVTSVRLVDGGLDGVLAVGPLASPIYVPVSANDLPDVVEELRAADALVDTSWEVGRLTALAREAQARSRYFGLQGGDVRTHALRLERLDPGNRAAASLLLKVGERLAWEADAALQDGMPDRARALVAECLDLVPEHSRCLEVSGQL